MATTTPFTFGGSLDLPPDPGLAVVALPFSGSSTFTFEHKQVVQLTGSGTFALPLTGLPSAGARAVLIEVDTGTAVLPIQVVINGGTDQQEISAGGFWAHYSPNPVAGITSLSITYASDVCVTIRVLG